jgi:signal transduction histidine kinase
MPLQSSIRWSWPRDRWERGILAGSAIAVVLAALAGMGTLRSRVRVHQAAIASLTNYAAVGIEQYVNGYENLLRQSFVPLLPSADYSDPTARRDPLPASALIGAMSRMRSDPCRCRIAPGPTAVFRLGLDVSDVEVLDSLGTPVPALDPGVGEMIRHLADSLVRLGWRYGFQVTSSSQGPQFTFFTVRADSATHRRYAYGFTVPAERMAQRVFLPAFRTARLVPRNLLATVSRNDQFVSIDLATYGGLPLYATTPAYPDGPSDGLTLPSLRGGLIVRAQLNPALKDALIPGGIPPRIPVRDMTLIALSLAVPICLGVLGLRVASVARLRSDLASGVTHELRTPLTQIRLAAETVLLGRSRSPESERQSLGSIVDESKRLQQLIDNVLHFSRAERRMTSVRAEPVELRPVVERASGDLAAVVGARGIAVRVDVPDGLAVQGDANALRQILLNLVDNAARYGPDQEIIVIGAAGLDGHVELWVEDRGPGVPAADRKRVWDAFVRLDRDRDSAVTGTGLGLAVVRELVAAQGGTCRIEGASGGHGGARVVIRLARGAER